MKLFHNLEKKSLIEKQENFDGLIIKKRRGAPKKPNMVAKKIKIDKILYKQVSDTCKSQGMTISSFLSIALRKELSTKS